MVLLGGLLKTALQKIVEEKMIPIRFVSSNSMFYNSYLIFDTTKQIGHMTVFDEMQNEVYLYVGFEAGLLPMKPMDYNIIRCPHWLDFDRKDERKLFKALRRNMVWLEKQMILTDEREVSVDHERELDSISENNLLEVLSYKPHDIYMFTPEYRKELLSLIGEKYEGTEIEYYL